MDVRRNLIKTAVTSRTIVIIIQYIANNAVPDHDAGVFMHPPSASNQNQKLDGIVSHFVGGFLRWDAHYFMHISLYGYTYENTLAFFPLCPLLIKSLTLLLSPVFPFISLDSLTFIFFLITNFVFFILSALALYDLTALVLNKDIALKSAILFCYNPASVFFSAPYTECLFSYLTFKSMLNSILFYKSSCAGNMSILNGLKYCIPIALSVLTRSNGLLNIGFLVYAISCVYLHRVKAGNGFFAGKLLVLAVLLSLFCAIPFIFYQIYSFRMFCTTFEIGFPKSVLDYGTKHGFVFAGAFPAHNQSWCYAGVPLAYSYVQARYWNVGFLRYYETKQIPNFLLAAPIVAILAKGTIIYLKRFPKRLGDCFTLHLLLEKRKIGGLNPLMFVFVVHTIVLVVFSVFTIHVQVVTRMLCSASPLLYWFGAIRLGRFYGECNLFKLLKFVKFYSGEERFIIVYFCAYFVVGTAMFCNFLPWT